MLTCEVCDAKVVELRRGRCWGCYTRWACARPVGLGARCITCAEQRRRVLKMVELFGGWSPMCFNCAGQLLHLDPLPPTLAALRDAVSRERRRADRRIGKPDTRVLRHERRVGARRHGTAGEERSDADMIGEVVGGAELELGGEPGEDVTRIRELVEVGDVLELAEA